MNREEATHVLKEIITGCDLLADAVMLMPPNADDVFSKGYQLHIKSSIHQNNLSCIKTITEAHKLSMAVEPDKDMVVIYKRHSE